MNGIIFKSAIYTMLIICIFFAAACQPDIPSTNWDPSLGKSAVEKLETGNCASFWQSIMPHVKARQPEAISLLSSAMYSFGLIPPGTSDDILFRARSILAVYAQSVRNEEPVAMEMIKDLVQNNLFPDASQKQLIQCLASGSQKNTCIDSAIKDGLFPDFSTWLAEIEKLESKGDKAHCLKKMDSQKLSDEDFDITPS